jgi:hypothetical protein
VYYGNVLENDGLSNDSSSHIFEANNRRVTNILRLSREVPFVVKRIELYCSFCSEYN